MSSSWNANYIYPEKKNLFLRSWAHFRRATWSSAPMQTEETTTQRLRPTAIVQLSTRAKIWQASHLSWFFSPLVKIKLQLTEPCTWTPCVSACVWGCW